MDLLHPIKFELIAIKRQIETVVAQINGLSWLSEEGNQQPAAAQSRTRPLIATKVGQHIAAVVVQLNNLISDDGIPLQAIDLVPGELRVDPPHRRRSGRSAGHRIANVWDELPEKFTVEQVKQIVEAKYIDPKLRRTHSNYSAALSKLVRDGYLEVALRPRGRKGIIYRRRVCLAEDPACFI